MMDMSPLGRAGTFLGFWSFCVTIARGVGVAGGGIIRDLALGAFGDFAASYGAVFVIGTLGILASAWSLRRVGDESFASGIAAPGSQVAPMLSQAMD